MPPAQLSPSSLLHIYYLEGKIAKQSKIADQNYIGTWVEDNFSFVFFRQPADKTVARLISEMPELQLLDTFEMTYEQWQGGRLEPHQIGSFLVTPPWFSPPPEEPSTILTIDPGVVFGNGLHPTTQDCLQAIEIACSGQRVKTVIDLGTGSGILAIAAMKRGCQRGLAIDYNFLAAQTAKNNCILNELVEQVVVINGQAEDFTTIAADLFVANIHYAVMQNLIQSKGFLQQKWFILSGLLSSEAEKVENILKKLPVVILQRWNRNQTWHTFLGITAE